MIRTLLRFSVAWLVAVLLSSTAPGKEASPFAGEWETTHGRMTLQAKGENVTGTYRVGDGQSHQLQGRAVAGILEFAYTEGQITGEGSFTLAEDGKSFIGKWREAGDEEWSSWEGRRAGTDLPDFNGVWKTSFGMMRLIQEGEKVRGCYQFGTRSEIEGTAADGVLTFTYKEPDGVTGKGTFKLSPDRNAFAGDWSADQGQQEGEWEGSRVNPDQRRKWLVVLEAHWEQDLRENEYSFGDMLRQFFTRIPEVGVRHRFFDEHEDFARWCAELAYLTEPIVLHISSHGTEQGITVGKHVLDGKFIGEQLRDCPHVKLVHLGACLTMAGTVAQDIRQASGGGFPVSGYTRSADWAGSAVIDFTYLDLIFSRDIKPGEAAGIVQKSISFSGESESHPGDIPPTGLKILE
jgi:hypothetical protein